MKILLLNANRVGIGTYHRTLHFGQELARRGHAATMMTVSAVERFRATTRQDPSGLEIIECPNWLDRLTPWTASGLIDIGMRIRQLWRNDYDLVYAFEYQPNISLPVFSAKMFRRFLLVSDWCDWHAGGSYHFGGYRIAHWVDRHFEEFIRHRADHVTTINRTLRDRALAIGVPADRVSIVEEGVDPSYIAPGDRNESRRELGLPVDARIVGTIRDAPSAGEMLCRAVATCSRSYPDAMLLVVGHKTEPLLRCAKQLGIAERLILPGRVTDEQLPKYLAAADVQALPLEDSLTNRGRWPHKLGDMLAAKRPVIVSLGGEFPQLILERDCGIVVAHDDAAFARAITDVFTSPARFEPVAARGRALIESELNWDVIGRKLDELLRRVAADRNEAH